ncbi:MAG TPA: BamA/TamA family outer membrane protein [Kofleriaceae bacterium]|nr:BamA/TamA family outer membrane protein [Kofleriaceae bacterium]
MSRRRLDVLAIVAALSAGLTPARAAAQPVPGVPEPGEPPAPPAGAATEPTELEARRPDVDRRDGPGPGWVILPGINYAPEPGLTVGGALLRYFRLTDDPETRLSSHRLQASVSLKGRGEVSFDPSLWAADDGLHLGGTLNASYFDYPYYGIGNDTRAADREDFTSMRVHARPEAAARVWRDLFAGVLYDFRYEDITAVEEGGMVDAGPVGSEGGTLSGVGGILRWDSRDHSFAPRQGGVVSFSPRLYRRGLGSDHDFGRLLLDASWFVGLGGEHVVAVDGRGDFRTGAPPFDHLSLAGGSRLLRGMIEGRFRDNHFLGGQVEYRFPLFWRVGGVAFGGAGRVADEVRHFELDGWHWAAGGGVRFAVNQDERINLRFDAGATAEGSNVYLAIGEAF